MYRVVVGVVVVKCVWCATTSIEARMQQSESAAIIGGKRFGGAKRYLLYSVYSSVCFLLQSTYSNLDVTKDTRFRNKDKGRKDWPLALFCQYSMSSNDSIASSLSSCTTAAGRHDDGCVRRSDIIPLLRVQKAALLSLEQFVDGRRELAWIQLDKIHKALWRRIVLDGGGSSETGGEQDVIEYDSDVEEIWTERDPFDMVEHLPDQIVDNKRALESFVGS
jgi:hypothetical protein